jgi:hypothetical protein
MMLEKQNKPMPAKKRARYPTFFEAEQLLDEQEAFHADITVAAKLDLNRIGLGAIGMAFTNAQPPPNVTCTANTRPDLPTPTKP